MYRLPPRLLRMSESASIIGLLPSPVSTGYQLLSVCSVLNRTSQRNTPHKTVDVHSQLNDLKFAANVEYLINERLRENRCDGNGSLSGEGWRSAAGDPWITGVDYPTLSK